MAHFWPRPSVHEPSTLLGEPEQLHSGLELSDDYKHWALVYDEYVGSIGALGRLSRPSWLADALRLPAAARQRMVALDDLPPRGAWYMPLVGFAMLAKGGMPGEVVLLETPNTFVAHHSSGREFGVSMGLPVWNKPVTAHKSYRLWHRQGLSHLLAPYGASRRKASVMDYLRTWVIQEQGRFPEDFPQVLQALEAIYWRCDWGLPVELEMLIFESASDSLPQAVAYARQFRDFAEPKVMLREVLTPEYMSLGEFKERFGTGGEGGGPVTEMIAQRWDDALDLLQQSTQ